MNKLLTPLLLLLLVGCSARRQGPTAEEENATPSLSHAPRPAHFIVTPPPAELDSEGQRLYLRDHYWDRFDFRDTTLLSRLDTAEMMGAYAHYLARVIGPADTAAMRNLMKRASASKEMLTYFSMLGERLLYDPNSPLRSDELYLVVLETQANSPLYNEYEQARPRHQLELVGENLPGHPANDFRYTLADGSSSTLYALKAPYTLLFISNPGCPMCASVREAVISSPMLNSMIERGALKVLMLYPDSDLEEWHKHREEIPSQWIYAYDKGCHLQNERLYDLKAIPTLYLLNNKKEVLLKDVVEVAHIEYVIDQMQ